MTIMQKILMPNVMYRIKGFTLLESLLVLFICSFVIMVFAGSVRQGIRVARAEIFVLQFERLYKDTQYLASLKGESQTLQSIKGYLRSREEELRIPEEVEVNDFSITFDKNAGNSSLQKISLYLPYQEKTVSYQLEIGSGKYKKKIS